LRAAKDSAGHARWLSARSDAEVLRACAIALGLTWSVLFIVVGLGAALELYADGSMFSYAVAVQDVWAFHWHNISGRLSVFLLCLWPAETYVGLTGDPHGGIVLYGLLFYSAPLLGLIGTWAADRSQGRVFFSFACCTTALLCPLIFGFPTEMWLAHSLFWPALAVSHSRRTGIGAAALVFALLTALALTHEGAVILAFAVVATLAARGLRHPAFLRAAACLAAALAVWGAVKALYRPDGYFADMFKRAALSFFDPAIFRVDVVLLLAGTLAAYAIVYVFWRRAAPERALGAATALVAAALAGYFLGFDHSLHASNRYYLRTAFVIATPVLGALAAAIAMQGSGWRPVPSVSRLMALLTRGPVVRAFTGALLLVTLVHAVETAKFVAAWTGYKAAVRVLATGSASDPALGDPRFVSSGRIDAGLNRLSWFSTTPYLSAILAGFAPSRLVVDPQGNYFWLSCAAATANAQAARAVPAATRDLVRVYSCLHRP